MSFPHLLLVLQTASCVGLLLTPVLGPLSHDFLLSCVVSPSACSADGLWDYYSPESSVLSDTRRQMRRLEEDPQAVRDLLALQLGPASLGACIHRCSVADRSPCMLASLLCSTAELMTYTVLLTHVLSRVVSAGG